MIKTEIPELLHQSMKEKRKEAPIVSRAEGKYGKYEHL